jgi:hypothetical protein
MNNQYLNFCELYNTCGMPHATPICEPVRLTEKEGLLAALMLRKAGIAAKMFCISAWWKDLNATERLEAMG